MTSCMVCSDRVDRSYMCSSLGFALIRMILSIALLYVAATTLYGSRVKGPGDDTPACVTVRVDPSTEIVPVRWSCELARTI